MNKFFAAIKVCLKDKFFITAGRAGRAEFWWFTLFAIIIRVALYPLNSIQYLAVFYAVIGFFIFLAHYTVLVRRLHDTGRSGFHVAPALFGFLLILAGIFLVNPYIVWAGEGLSAVGGIYLLVLCVMPGNKGPNRYGMPSPL